jgi:hypothetical protein
MPTTAAQANVIPVTVSSADLPQVCAAAPDHPARRALGDLSKRVQWNHARGVALRKGPVKRPEVLAFARPPGVSHPRTPVE